MFKKLNKLSLLLVLGLVACGGGGATNEEPGDEEEEEPEPTTATVSEALSIINGQADNVRSELKYAVSGVIKEVTAEYNAQLCHLTFTVADTLESSDSLVSYRTYAESEYVAQEYVPGAGVSLIGRLMKSVEDGVTTPMIVSPIAEITNSLLVDPTDITITSSLTLETEETAEIEVSWAPENARKEPIEWVTSNSEVATVENGKVKGVAPGTATITANTSFCSRSCEVTVNESAKKIVVEFAKVSGGDIPTTPMAAENVINTVVSKGEEYLESCTEANTVYLQPECIRLGNSAKPGSVTFSLKESIKVNKVVISAMKYQNDTCTVNFAATGFNGELTFEEVASNANYSDITYALGDVSITDFTLSNSAKRVFIKSIMFVLSNEN